MPRRVLTKSSIDELLAGGTTELHLEADDIVTALAKEYAQQRGLRLIPAVNAAAGKASAPGAVSPGAAPPPEPGREPIPDAAAVRKAVIAAVGYEPDGLDAIIARIMK